MEKTHKPILEFSTASRLAELGLSGIQCEYPNSLERFLPKQAPRVVHPAFYGCFDWHSAVHTHWMLIKLLRLFPDLPKASVIRTVLNANLTAENLAAEVANFDQTNQLSSNGWIRAYSQPGQTAFERPYGWAWVLQLAAELHTWNDPDAHKWSQNLQPLLRRIVELYNHFLVEHLTPDRGGQHLNTAFALALALDYARICSERELEKLIVQYGLAYYTPDTNYPAHLEPGFADFFSAALTEADFMRRILKPSAFTDWFNLFLPDVASGQPASLLQLIIVPDHDDPYIGHLDGLNLSRAWCMYNIAAALPERNHSRPILLQAAERHAKEGLAHIFAGNYKSSGHWLHTFAVYLLTGAD